MTGSKDATPPPDPRLEIARAIDEGEPIGDGPDVGEADAPAEPKPRRKPAGARKGSGGGKGRAKSRKAASVAEREDDEASGSTKRRRTPQRDGIMALTEACSLWHDADGEAFVTLPLKGHYENWPVRSDTFKRWLAAAAYEQTGFVPGSQAVEDTLRVLEARATTEGVEREPWVRVGSRAGRLYIDLLDAGWRVIEIGSSGWHVIEGRGLPFIRAKAMRPLPEPEAGCEIDELRRFINCATDADFTLVTAWLIAALRNTGPYPILVINGEQGSGKSTFSRLLRTLCDPNAAPIRAVPRDDRDLIISAANAHVLAMDNLSKVEPWLADALCRLATGSGFSARKLHTDRDEFVFMASRPIILNGIPALTDRADLADRAVTVRLRSIPEDERLPEDEFWADWGRVAPRVLGALCDGLSAALRNVGGVRLERAPRLADFAKWATAAERGLGWEPGSFLAAYGANRRDTFDEAFEADIVAVAVVRFVGDRTSAWEGSATDLLAALGDITPETVKNQRSWPKLPNALSARLERIAPLLRAKGLLFHRKHSGVRTITLAPAGVGEEA